MAKFGNRVKETTQTNGTATIDLDGAVSGAWNAFADEFTSGDDEISYLITDSATAPTVYEYGRGTFTAGTPNTLSRDTVIKSSAGAATKISLNGTNLVIASPLAEDLAAAFGAGGWGTKSAKVKAITTNTAQVAADDGKLILADGSGNSPVGLTYTLLAEATAGDGYTFTVRNDGSSGAVTIADDAAATLLVLENEGDSATFYCDGTSWHIVARTVFPGVLSVTGNYTITGEDKGKLILANGDSNSPAGLTLTFDDAATLGQTFGVDLRNVGATSAVALATANSPADQIDGADTATLAAGESTRIRCTGTTFYSFSGGGGDLVRIGNTVEISADSEVEFTDLSDTYREYRVVLQNIVSTDDADNLNLQVSVNNGSSYLSTNEYSYHTSNGNEGSAAYAGEVGATTTRLILATGTGINTGENVSGVVSLINPANASVYKGIIMEIMNWGSAGALRERLGACGVLTTSAINAIRIYCQNNTIASGKITLYGLK